MTLKDMSSFGRKIFANAVIRCCEQDFICRSRFTMLTLIGRFRPKYLEGRPELVESQTHHKVLSANHKDFIADFIFYVTGSSYLPIIDMNPNYEFVVEFIDSLDNDSLPAASTCANTLIYQVGLITTMQKLM